MEKLRELLNEFDPYIAKDWEHRDNLWYGVIWWGSAIFTPEIWVLKIISKEYWFIEWLVKNNKIDWDFNELKPIMLDPGCDMEEWLYGEEVDKVDMVLMYLSIQEDPIWFLISILK